MHFPQKLHYRQSLIHHFRWSIAAHGNLKNSTYGVSAHGNLRTFLEFLRRECARKPRSLYMGQIYHCGCVNDQYLSPYQTRAFWLPWLLRKSRPFLFIYRPLGPIYFHIWGIFTIVGVWMIITRHIYQTRANWLPWLLRKSRPFIF